MQDIRIHVDLTEVHNSRFKNITDKEDFYGTPEYFKAYQNWRKNHNLSEDLLTDLATSAVASGFNAVRHVFSQSFNKAAEKAINDAVKDIVKSNPNMTWTD